MAREKRPQNQYRGAHRLHQLVGRLVRHETRSLREPSPCSRGSASRIPPRESFSSRRIVPTSQHVGNVRELEGLLGENRGRHFRKRCVLGAADRRPVPTGACPRRSVSLSTEALRRFRATTTRGIPARSGTMRRRSSPEERTRSASPGGPVLFRSPAPRRLRTSSTAPTPSRSRVMAARPSGPPASAIRGSCSLTSGASSRISESTTYGGLLTTRSSVLPAPPEGRGNRRAGR